MNSTELGQVLEIAKDMGVNIDDADVRFKADGYSPLGIMMKNPTTGYPELVTSLTRMKVLQQYQKSGIS